MEHPSSEANDLGKKNSTWASVQHNCQNSTVLPVGDWECSVARPFEAESDFVGWFFEMGSTRRCCALLFAAIAFSRRMMISLQRPFLGVTSVTKWRQNLKDDSCLVPFEYFSIQFCTIFLTDCLFSSKIKPVFT